MKYNPDIHHRRSIRYKDYDYSNPGSYFVTICVNDHQCLFGDIQNEKMIHNVAGQMVDKWWTKCATNFCDIQLDEYVIMPDHMHAIIAIVGAHPCVRPLEPTGSMGTMHPCVRPMEIPPCCPMDPVETNDILNNIKNFHRQINTRIKIMGGHMDKIMDEHMGTMGGHMEIMGEWGGHMEIMEWGGHMGPPLRVSICDIIRWFKTMTTNEYIRNVKNNHWPPFEKRFWQRSFYDRIIRDENDLNRIREYIQNNPRNWDQ